MKIMLLILVVVLFSVFGYGLSRWYSERKDFFFSLVELLKNLKSQIGFSHGRLFNLLENGREVIGNKHVNVLIDNYTSTVLTNNVIDGQNLFLGINFLNEQEKSAILNFFNCLGKSDVGTQLEELNAITELVNNYGSEAKNAHKKYGSLCVKLGIMAGLFVALIFA